MNEKFLEGSERFLSEQTDRAISNIRSSVPKGEIGPKFCVLCDNEIPDKRRVHGFDTCVPCATIREQKGRHYVR